MVGSFKCDFRGVQGSPVPGFHTSSNRAVRLPLYAGGALEERERTDNPFPSASVLCFGRRGLPRLPVSTLQTLGLWLPAVWFNLGLAFGNAAPPLGTHLDNTLHSHPVSQRRQRRDGYRHARPCLRFQVPHFRRVLNPFHAQLHALGCHSLSTWARCYPVLKGEGLSPSWKLSSLTPPSERK